MLHCNLLHSKICHMVGERLIVCVHFLAPSYQVAVALCFDPKPLYDKTKIKLQTSLLNVRHGHSQTLGFSLSLSTVSTT